MKQAQNARSRRQVVFIRAHTLNGIFYPIGTRLQVRTEKFNELIEKKLINEYSGPWPPKNKTKFNLKDLK
jgi:hypothetical protein